LSERYRRVNVVSLDRRHFTTYRRVRRHAIYAS
jgi:hypothetical protein